MSRRFYNSTKGIILLVLCASMVTVKANTVNNNTSRVDRAAHLQGWYTRLGFALGRSVSGGTQTVNITPSIMNTYQATDTANVSLLTLGEGYRWKVSPNWQLGFELQADYIDYGQMGGIVHRMSNIAPDFDTNGYRYNARSYAVLGQFDVNWWRTAKSFIRLSASLGTAWNNLSDYSEHQLSNASSVSASVKPFGDNTSSNLAFGVGVGAGYAFNRNVAIEFGYRYINTGSASFSAPSGIAGGLSSGTLSAHTIYINVLL